MKTCRFLLVGITRCRGKELLDLPEAEAGSAQTRRSASNTKYARGNRRSGQFLTSARGNLCTREDGAASGLGQSSVASHACSLYDGEIMGRRSSHSSRLWHTMLSAVKEPMAF
jgi:hypothetical protein